MKKIKVINDGWLFSKGELNFDSNHAIQVNIPHCWNAEDGQDGGDDYYRGPCWYMREMNITVKDLEQHIFIEVGAANTTSEVLINGVSVGINNCGYSLYRFNISPFLKTGSNQIIIRVDNSYQDSIYPLMADFTFYGGLYRDVKLIYTDSIHFDYMDGSRQGIYVQQQNVSTKSATLKIIANLVNEKNITEDIILKGTLLDQDKNKIKALSTPMTINKKQQINISITVENPHLWQGTKDPYLYTLHFKLYNKGNYMLDQQTIQIGFRDIVIDPDKGFFLNAEPLKIKGVSRHQDRKGLGNAITKEHMEGDMDIILSMGANSIRLAHYQHHDYFYQLCDEKGLLVWAEIPFISVPSSVDKTNINAKEHLEKLIKQAINHPSIYCWGIQNEITIAGENESIYDKVGQLHKLTKNMDPTRYTAQSQIYSVVNNSLLNELSDIIGYNLYYGWYYGEMQELGKRLDAFHKDQPTKPIIISEYGVDTNSAFHSYEPKVKDYTEEYQLHYHLNAIKTFMKRDFVYGSYVWNMFDFGSDGRDEGGLKGINAKGLVSFDRKLKKDAYFLYKAYWSEDPFIYLAGRRFINRHKTINDIIVLTNLNHFKVYLNDQLIQRVEHTQPLNIIGGVSLQEGTNTIKVVSDAHIDCIILYRVPNPDETYIYHHTDKQNKVINWFEKFDLTSDEFVQIRDGYFSTHDLVADLLVHEQAKEVFLKYFSQMLEHPKAKSLMGHMTIEGMAKIRQLNIPKALLNQINKELTVIKKR